MKKLKKVNVRGHQVHAGSGNVFTDLGLGDQAPDLQAKAALTHQIYARLKSLSLNQSQAALRLKLAQPDVSKLMNGRFTGFSVERLIALLNALDVDVEIVVRPQRTDSSTAQGALTVRIDPVLAA